MNASSNDLLDRYIDPYVEKGFGWLDLGESAARQWFFGLSRVQQLSIAAIVTGLAVVVSFSGDLPLTDRLLFIWLLICCSGWCVQPMFPQMESMVIKMTAAYFVLAPLWVQSVGSGLVYLWTLFVASQYAGDDLPRRDIVLLVHVMVVYSVLKRVWKKETARSLE